MYRNYQYMSYSRFGKTYVLLDYQYNINAVSKLVCNDSMS